MGGIVTADAYHHFDWKKEEAFAEHLRTLEPGTYWCHYGGRFDMMWWLDFALKRDIKCKLTESGSAVISVQAGKVILRDSFSLVPISLEQAAEIGKLEKIGTGLPCVCLAAGKDRECGGYCQISRTMPEKLRRELARYMRRDCEALFAILQNLKKYATRYNLDLKNTLGASAYATAKRRFSIPDAKWKRTYDYKYCRQAFYGGRTEGFGLAAPEGYAYDINSAYPWALSEVEFPTGRMLALGSRAAAKHLAQQTEGIYHVEVDQPHEFVPVLPYRLRDRVSFPEGRVTGYWTRLELDYAISRGARIRRVFSARIWLTRERLLREFALTVWNLRSQSNKQSGMGKYLKLYANSLYGKLAMRPDNRYAVFNPDDPKPCDSKMPCKSIGRACGDGICCAHKCREGCMAWTEMREGSNVWSVPSWRLAECAHIHWACYVTSAVRIKLHKQLVDPENSVLYCDTDSCFATLPRTADVGGDLGQWQSEGRIRNWECYAPKIYRYERDAWRIPMHPGLRFAAKAKGFPNADVNWEAIGRGDAIVIEDGVETFRTAIQSGDGLFKRKHTERRLHRNNTWCGSRKIGKDGRTYAQPVSVLHKVFGQSKDVQV
jgi:hypothetical protein